MLGPLLNSKSDLSARNGVLLYKQLIRPMMDYACPAWSPSPPPLSAGYRCYTPSVFALLLVLPGYVSKRQIQDDRGVPLFSDHIRALTASYDSRFAEVGNPLVRQLGK